MQYRIMLVERNRLLAGKISKVINDAPNMELVVSFQNVSDALGQGRAFAPNIILLDTDDENATNIVREFVATFPNIVIICTGERWQAEKVNLYIQLGANGYLVKPFTYEGLLEAISTYISGDLEADAKVVTFFSPKGKSGKSTLIANLAMALAERTGEKVAIIDADLQFGDMSVFFSLEPHSTIVEAARDAKMLSPLELRSYFQKINDGVYVLAGTKAPNYADKVAIADLELVIKMSQSLFKYILIDVPAGFNPTSIATAELSHLTYIVSMINGAYEVQHTQRALQIFSAWDDYQKRVRTVFTRVNPCNEEAQRNLAERINYPVDAVIPNAFMVVSKAANSGQMATQLEPDSQLAQNIEVLANHILQTGA